MSCRNTARRGLVAISTAMLTAMTFFSAVAVAQDEEADDAVEATERRNEKTDADWMPSIGFNFGFHTQSIDGTTSSSTATITPGNGDSYISQLVGFEGRLYTPLRFEDVPTKPRLFISSRFYLPLAEELIAERIEANFSRNPGGGGGGDDPAFLTNCAVNIPDLSGNPSPGQSCSLRIRNKVTIEEMFSAGLGIDLTLPIFDEQFHIQPSLEYFGMTVQSVGEFRRTTAGNPGVNDLVETAAAVGDQEFYHAISPALTFLVDVYEEGPFRWSMWMQGRVMFFLNEPSIRSGSSLGTNQIGFLVEIDDFAPQATVGFHVTYTGKKRRR